MSQSLPVVLEWLDERYIEKYDSDARRSESSAAVLTTTFNMDLDKAVLLHHLVERIMISNEKVRCNEQRESYLNLNLSSEKGRKMKTEIYRKLKNFTAERIQQVIESIPMLYHADCFLPKITDSNGLSVPMFSDKRIPNLEEPTFGSYLHLKETCPTWPRIIHSGSKHLEFVLSWEAPSKCVLHRIGRGSTADVFLGRVKSGSQRLVAIKLIRNNIPADIAIHEAAIMTHLQKGGLHIMPHCYGIVPMTPWGSGAPELYRHLAIVTEFWGEKEKPYTATSLNDLMHAALMYDKTIPLPNQDEWMRILRKIVSYVQLIHTRKWALVDLKGDNILMKYRDEKWKPIIIDVGNSLQIGTKLPEDDRSAKEMEEKFGHLAPELALGEKITEKVDSFSLGQIIYHVQTAACLNGLLDDAIMACLEKQRRKRISINNLARMLRTIHHSLIGDGELLDENNNHASENLPDGAGNIHNIPDIEG